MILVSLGKKGGKKRIEEICKLMRTEFRMDKIVLAKTTSST